MDIRSGVSVHRFNLELEFPLRRGTARRGLRRCRQRHRDLRRSGVQDIGMRGFGTIRYKLPIRTVAYGYGINPTPRNTTNPSARSTFHIGFAF
jgi:hypothetical protein